LPYFFTHTQGANEMPTIVALNPGKKRGKRKGKAKRKKRRNLTAKQIKYFGTARQKAALKTKKKRPAKKKTAAKRTASTSKGTNVMAKKRRKYSKKRAKRRNPSGGGTRGSILGVNMMGAVKSGVPLLFGALIAKFTAKKFADGGGEMDNWTWKNYSLGLVGGLVAAFATGAILKKRAAAQKVFEGALLLVGYKLFTNDIATQNPTLESWFGANDFDPYGSLSDGMGDIWQSGSSNYVRGVDGYWRPADESHRKLPAPGRIPYGYRQGIRKGMGDVLVDPDSRYGDVMVTPDSRYGETPSARLMSQAIEADGM
jgi:hypothetical protein